MQCLAQISHNPCTAFKKYVTIQQHADTDTPKSATVLFKINATHCCYTQILYNQVIWPELYYHYVVAPPSLNHTHCHPPPPHHPPPPSYPEASTIVVLSTRSNSYEIWICISHQSNWIGWCHRENWTRELQWESTNNRGKDWFWHLIKVYSHLQIPLLQYHNIMIDTSVSTKYRPQAVDLMEYSLRIEQRKVEADQNTSSSGLQD